MKNQGQKIKINYTPELLSIGLTTTSERLYILKQTINSLLNQDYENYIIILSISKKGYLSDKGIDEIPNWLHNRKIIINYTENTGSYRKLLPSILDLQNESLYVTADDDVIYGPNWLSLIKEAADNNRDKIICGRARKIKKNIFGRYQNYRNWSELDDVTVGSDIIPIGCAGVAYRPILLDKDFLMDPIKFDIAPTSDDIWFRLASVRKNILVYVNPKIDEKNLYILHKHGLAEKNARKMNSKKSRIPIISKIIEYIAAYMGFSGSNNDAAWRGATRYGKCK
jgi:hypothetical protein